MATRVFTATESLDAITATPGDTFAITAKKEAKTFQGTTFFNIRFSIADQKNKEGWFNNQVGVDANGQPIYEDIPLARGMADPKDKKDKRNDYEGTRMQLETTVSRAGKTGQFLLKAQPVYVEKVKANQAAGIMIANKPINDLISVKISDDNPDPAKRGQPLQDPGIRFKVEFDPFPEGYPTKALVGQPKTQFFDWNTRTVDAEGKESFQPATVADRDGNPVPVTKDNVHEFANRGAVIKRIRYFITSVPQAKGQISCPIVANRVVLQPGGPEGFSDDFGVAPVSKPTSSVAPTSSPSAPAPTANTGNNNNAPAPTPSVAAANSDDVAAAILAAASGLN
jgi:hypothetical protein